MSTDPKLSDGIGRVLKMLPSEVSDTDVFEIDAPNVNRLIETLITLQRYAVHMEMELVCLRDMEAGREIRTFLNEEAEAHLSDMMKQTEGKVIRPNFRRKP